MRLPHPIATTCVALTLCAAAPLAAQEDEDQAYIYASYYQCAPGGISTAVQTLRDVWSPVMQEHVDAGDVTAWGALTHSTGNEWSLGLYQVGPDLDALMGAIGASIQRLYEENSEAGAAFSDACPRHEDYVWLNMFSSDPAANLATERSEAGLSVYWVCDEGRESVADLVFEELMAPAWNEQVEAGLVNSWSWSEHYLGGKFRRLLATDGPDHASLLEARNNVIESFGENPGLAAAFSDVCDGHQDNLYDIVLTRP